MFKKQIIFALLYFVASLIVGGIFYGLADADNWVELTIATAIVGGFAAFAGFRAGYMDKD